MGLATADGYLHEGPGVVWIRRPSPRSVLIAAVAAGYTHLIVDGTLVRTDPGSVSQESWSFKTGRSRTR